MADTANNNNTAVYAAAISAGVDTMNMVSATKANKKGREHASAENQKNRDYATEMWNKQNQYNERVTDPAYNMARLKAAGINPHLAYSNGTDIQNPVSNSVPTPSQGQQMPAPYHPRVDPTVFANLALQHAQINNINAQTKNIEANTENTSIIAGMNAQDLENKSKLIDQENTIRDINISQGNSGIALTNVQVDKEKQNIINLISTNESINQGISESINRMQLNDAQKAQYIANLAVMRATVQNIQANTNLTNNKNRTETAYRSNIEADTANKGQQLESMKRDNYIGEQVDLTDAKSNMQFNQWEAKRAVEMFNQAESNSKIQNLKVTEQQYINDLRLLEIGEKGIDITTKAVDIMNPLRKSRAPQPQNNTTTSTRFDREGNYNGHTTTRRTR